MTDNETIADIRKDAETKFRELVEAYIQRRSSFQTTMGAMQAFNNVFDRLEAAHKREVREAVTDCNQFSDAAKLREAHWVGIKYDSACCSKCGAHISTGFDTTSQAKDGWGNLYPYCPYCGAKMDLTIPFEVKSRNKKTK